MSKTLQGHRTKLKDTKKQQKRKQKQNNRIANSE